MPPHALSLPFEPIKDVGDYWCDVTVRNPLISAVSYRVVETTCFSYYSYRNKAGIRKLLSLEILIVFFPNKHINHLLKDMFGSKIQSNPQKLLLFFVFHKLTHCSFFHTFFLSD